MTDGVSDTDFEDALGEAKAEGNLSRANVVRKIRQRRPTPTGAGGHVPDSADRSPEAAACRQELIGEFAASGMSSRQIAQRLGICEDTVRQVARDHGIDIRADTVLGRTRRPDSNRIVRETVHALEGLAMGVELADPAGFDAAEAAEWAVSMNRSIRLLTKFVRQMKETIHDRYGQDPGPDRASGPAAVGAAYPDAGQPAGATRSQPGPGQQAGRGVRPGEDGCAHRESSR
jgi:hypothetical protein